MSDATTAKHATTLPGTSVTTCWELVTPETAMRYLGRNKNRKQRPAHIKRMVSDITADRWQDTHQGIAFDTDGVLRDGQHRLQAIIASDKELWMLVTRGLPADAQVAMDGGSKRQVADFVDGKYGTIRTAASKVLIAINKLDGKLTVNKLTQVMNQSTTLEIREWTEELSEDMLKFATKAKAAAENTTSISPSALLAAALVYPDTADEFLDGIASMEGLQPGDPRKTLLRFRPRANRRIQTPESAFLALKAARAFAEEEELRVMRFSRDTVLKVPTAGLAG